MLDEGDILDVLESVSKSVVHINTVMDCVERIKTYGQVTQPWVGIYGVAVTPQVASYYNLMIDSGVLVTNVVPESPAQRARVSSGDVIIAIDGARVSTIQDLIREIDLKKVGDRAELAIAWGRMKGTVELRIEGSP